MNMITWSPTARNGHSAQAAPTTPEALCSVNLFFDVQGFGKAQATGRGATPLEAVSNLQGTIQHTKLALEAPVLPAPQTREERLAALLTCGLTKATARQDWGLVERLSKAAALVLSGAVSPGEREGMLAVQSQSQSTAAHWYEVDGMACSCPDYVHRHKEGEKQYFCKHGLACAMYRKLEAQEVGA